MTEQALGGSPSDYLSYMTRYGMTVLVAAALGLVAWLGACSDSPCANCPPPPPPSGLIGSDPITSPSTTVSSSAGIERSLLGTENAVYVTLFPGTVAAGRDATVHVVGSLNTVITSVIDGGFDPIPIAAGVGDSIEVVLTDDRGAVVQRLGLSVAARRPPVIVRTEPPPKKRDHPLNAAIVVVFSEPVDGSSLSSSTVQLFRGSSLVAGTVRLVQGNGSTAAFTPAAPLASNTDYRLVVTGGVRDLQGDRLSTGVTSDFRTGATSTGPPAAVQTLPDSQLALTAGATYQLAATVRDSAGNMLIDEPVTWSSDQPGILSVSPTGLLTALGDGFAVVSATVGGRIRDFVIVFISPDPPASVVLAPTPATVTVGDTILLTATVRDGAGRLINQPSLSWTSSNQSVASVADAGNRQAIVTGVNQGSATITANTDGVSGVASITVGPRAPVASVTVAPASATLTEGTRVQLSATLRDANDKVLFSRPITWTSDNPGVATVDASGLVTAVSLGSAAVIATSEGVSDSAAITVAKITFASLSSHWGHTCGLTVAPTGAAYCWGPGVFGILGNGSTDDSPIPVAVSGGLSFSAIATGAANTCAVTTSGAPYCWGRGDLGALGTGSGNSSSTPVAVSGGLTFLAVSAGGEDACGLTPSGAAYCWGDGQTGGIGNGSFGLALVPVPVSGGLTFSDVSAGIEHSCGVATSGAAYCWGHNDRGELGNGSTAHSAVPVVVSGGLTFSGVSSGYQYACGITTRGAAYCWGSNDEGQLGTGSTNSSLVPVPVRGGLTFSSLSAGWFHTCGVTTSGAAYCWGQGRSGQLGTGTTDSSLVPVAVTGGLTFSAVGAGGEFSCGLTTIGVVYCWGWNSHGELGDGSKTPSLVPVKVLGQP